jgi:acyl carrier protein
MPPLRGVVHAAAVLDDRTLAALDEPRFWSPIRPKILGAWHLHVGTRGAPLDFFVMYSSVAALMGSPGQTAYAAGNAFLDALAQARTAEGLPALSVQWGPFAEVGLAAAQENRGNRLSSRGFKSFAPDAGTALLFRLLERPRAVVGLLQISWRHWFESTPQAAGQLFSAELEREEAAPRPAGAGTFRDELEAATPADRGAELMNHLLEQLGRVLRLEPARIDRRAPFTSLGVDSLSSMELRNRLEASLGLQLSAALLFTHPTSTALAAHLLEAIYPSPASAPAPVAPSAAPPAPDLHDLGADDLLAMLDAELSLARKNDRTT